MFRLPATRCVRERLYNGRPSGVSSRYFSFPPAPFGRTRCTGSIHPLTPNPLFLILTLRLQVPGVLFLIDVSYSAVQCGQLHSATHAIRTVLQQHEQSGSTTPLQVN